MNANYRKYNLFNVAAGIFLMLMLLWLTVSMPFVARNQQKLAATEKSSSQSGSETGTNNETTDWNSFGNTTEEKTESGTGGFSEYLHEADELIHNLPGYLRHSSNHSSELYIAFHGELLSPPPEV